MGTNYYLHTEECECCGKADEPMHIGKSSAGWKFKLCAVESINDKDCLAWWRYLFVSANYHIRNEYGNRIPPAEMYVIIAERLSQKKPTLGITELIANRCSIDYKYNLLQFNMDNEFVRSEIPDTTYQVCYGEFS